MARRSRGGSSGAVSPGESRATRRVVGPRTGTYRIDTGTAELVGHAADPETWTLLVNGVQSSPVNTADPTVLDFEYLRWMADVIDLAGEPGTAVDAVHLGGAACSLPRYVEATRPGSRQVVVEVDAELARLVRTWFDLPRSPALRLQVGDARERLATRRDASADLVVRDVFSGDTTPSHLTTVELVADVRRVLRPAGVYVANVADRPPLAMLRAELASLREVFRHSALIAETAMLRGRRYANAVMVGSDAPLPLAALARRLASGSVPSRLVVGGDLTALVAGTPPRRDAASAVGHKSDIPD